MENVKYIPGDLVKIYGDICRVKGVRKRDNSLTPCLIEAKVVSDTENIVRAVGDDSDSIEPIPITPQILETNGWDLSIIKNRNYWSKVSSDEELLRFKSLDASIQRIAVKDKIALIYFSNNPNTFFFELSHKVIKIKYVHQLQHLLFGLGLDSSLKV